MRALRRARNRKSADGIALVTVLLLVSLLSVLAAVVLGIARTHARTANRAFQLIEAETLADSAIKLRLLQIATPRHGQSSVRSSADSSGAPSTMAVGVSTVVERENGRIDLNSADPLLFLAFFAANGFDEDVAETLAQRIEDWRDADSGSDRGPEQSNYSVADLSYGPRNATFETTEELRQVPGLAELSDALLDGFTVYTHAITVVPIPSIPSVMNALRWADSRQLGGHRWLDENVGRAGETSDDFIGDTVRIRACVSRGVSLCRVTIVSLTGNPENPFQVFAWHTELRED